MDTTQTLNTAPATRVRGEFAPVYWEPLGRRAERLVAGFLLSQQDRPATAIITLQHRRLLEFISAGRANSAQGILEFAFEHFRRTLDAGGIIEDLRTPFANMHIGRTEPISAATEQQLQQRALRLCTLLGQMPSNPSEADSATRTAARTMTFLRGVRQRIRSVDKSLAALAMKSRQTVHLNGAAIRTHFQFRDHLVQFCSLPLPNARAEAATECTARLAELAALRGAQIARNVALCINTQSLEHASSWHGRSNATRLILARTLGTAQALDIETHQENDPMAAAAFLRHRIGREALA